MRRLLFSLMLCGAGSMPAMAQLADPTIPPASLRTQSLPGEEELAEPVMRLQSILISPRRRIAVIDGQAVREGRRFKGGMLLEVAPAQVVVEKNGRRETLKLYPAEGQREAAQNKRTRQD